MGPRHGPQTPYARSAPGDPWRSSTEETDMGEVIHISRPLAARKIPTQPDKLHSEVEEE